MAIVAVRKAIFAHFGDRDRRPALLIPASASNGEQQGRQQRYSSDVTSSNRRSKRDANFSNRSRDPGSLRFTSRGSKDPLSSAASHLDHVLSKSEREREGYFHASRDNALRQRGHHFPHYESITFVDANDNSNVNFYRANYAPIIIHTRVTSQWHTMRRVVRAAD